MFKFNFQVENESGTTNEKGSSETTDINVDLAAKEESFTEHFTAGVEKSDKPVLTLSFAGKADTPLTVRYVDSRSVNENLAKAKEGLADLTKDSDLVAGVYEGGLKIWECSIDLASFMTIDVDTVFTASSKVLELGCGAALPGIVAGLLGAGEVHFQDYNDQVIEHITMPNVLLNFPNKGNFRFFSGDWKNLEHQMKREATTGYDVVLTSETIYNVQNYDKLISLLDFCLKSEGQILLAAKTHYFGVGGGIRLFEDALSKTKKWKFSTVKTFEDGVAREIIRISRN